MNFMVQNNICECCGKEFIPKYKTQRFCSRSCSASITNKSRTQTIETRLKISKSLRGELVNEIYQDQVCKYCGKPIQNIFKELDFCCNECRTRYFYELKVNDWLENPSNVKTTFIPRYIKQWLKETRGEKCEICGWHETNEFTNTIPLQIHHIDGDCTNNSPENLQILCPNSHSLTNNYCSRNMGKSKRNR